MALLNKLRPKHQVTPQIKFVLWFAGLRGAVAFSLSLDVESEHKEKIRTVTLLIVHFTLFVFGCSTLPLLKFLKIRSAGGDKSLENITKPPQKSDPSLRGLQPKRLINNLDERLFKKWFRRKVPPVSRDAVEVFESLVSGAYEHEMRLSNRESSQEENENENENEHEHESHMGILASAKPDKKIKVQGEPIIGQSPFPKEGLLSEPDHEDSQEEGFPNRRLSFDNPRDQHLQKFEELSSSIHTILKQTENSENNSSVIVSPITSTTTQTQNSDVKDSLLL